MITIISSLITLLIGYFAGAWLHERNARWQIRRDACLHALQLIDAVWSHRKWKDGGKQLSIQKQDKASIGDIRKIHNELICSCEEGEVPNLYRDLIMGDREDLRADSINTFRIAIRKELGFPEHQQNIETNNEKAWIGYIKEAEKNKPLTNENNILPSEELAGEKLSLAENES